MLSHSSLSLPGLGKFKAWLGSDDANETKNEISITHALHKPDSSCAQRSMWWSAVGLHVRDFPKSVVIIKGMQ